MCALFRCLPVTESNIPQVPSPLAEPSQNGPPFLTYRFTDTTYAQLEALAESAITVDGLVIDLTETFAPAPVEALIKFAQSAERLLNQRGMLVLVTTEGTITLSKDEPGKGLTYTHYANPMDIFVRQPSLAEHICSTVRKLDRRRLNRNGDSIANHILFSSIPVLTDRGRKVREDCVLPPQKQWLMQLVDDYLSLEAIAKTAEQRHGVSTPDTLRLLQEFETERLIYPIFARVQFLFNCFQRRNAFRLGRYMVAAQILTEPQLQELLERQQSLGRKNEKHLGLLAVEAGYVSRRQLEVLLADQYLYSQSAKSAGSEGSHDVNAERMKDSMMGSLGAIDSAGLLQSFAHSQKTGLLTIEDNDRSILMAFEKGKLTHARMNKVSGKDAMMELLVSWTTGIFLFRDGAFSQEFDEKCRLTNSLEKILLDAALAKDHVQQIFAQLPSGGTTVLERVWNFEAGWLHVANLNNLTLIDESQVNLEVKRLIYRIATCCDGLSSLEQIMGQIDECPGHLVAKGAWFLLEHKLLCVQQASFFRPLSIFQSIVNAFHAHLQPEDNNALLIKSLHYVYGDAGAQRFKIDKASNIGINLEEIKRTGTPVSVVIADLGRWMNAYLAYCRRLLGPDTVNGVTTRFLNSGEG